MCRCLCTSPSRQHHVRPVLWGKVPSIFYNCFVPKKNIVSSLERAEWWFLQMAVPILLLRRPPDNSASSEGAFHTCAIFPALIALLLYRSAFTTKGRVLRASAPLHGPLASLNIITRPAPRGVCRYARPPCIVSLTWPMQFASENSACAGVRTGPGPPLGLASPRPPST